MKAFRKMIVRQKGQALVEFALVLPVLILILFGIMEFGYLLMTYNVLTGAAREGVRVAAVTAPDIGRVQTAAQNLLSASNISGATVSVMGPNASNEVTVTVQFNYTPITGAIIPGVTTFLLVRSSTMRWEG
jgi:Flp pilus assembly protein TadG